MRICGDVAATYTWTQIRDATQDAIYALTVKGVSEYTIHGRMVTSLDLNTLHKQLAFANQQIAKETGRARDTLVGFRRPTA